MNNKKVTNLILLQPALMDTLHVSCSFIAFQNAALCGAENKNIITIRSTMQNKEGDHISRNDILLSN